MSLNPTEINIINAIKKYDKKVRINQIVDIDEESMNIILDIYNNNYNPDTGLNMSGYIYTSLTTKTESLYVVYPEESTAINWSNIAENCSLMQPHFQTTIIEKGTTPCIL